MKPLLKAGERNTAPAARSSMLETGIKAKNLKYQVDPNGLFPLLTLFIGIQNSGLAFTALPQRIQEDCTSADFREASNIKYTQDQSFECQ